MPDQPNETRERRLERRVAELKNRLAVIMRSYGECVKFTWSCLGFNESLDAAARSLNPRARGKPERKRVHPEFELLVNVRSLALARERDPSAAVALQRDVNEAARQLVRELKKRRYRPADTGLKHHVHAMMALWYEFSGEHLRASLTKDSVYDPHIRSMAGEAIFKGFRDLNPQVTMTQLANIIMDAHASGAIEGKRFRDFFPLYGAEIHPSTGEPASTPYFKVERFQRVAPIYSS